MPAKASPSAKLESRHLRSAVHALTVLLALLVTVSLWLTSTVRAQDTQPADDSATPQSQIIFPGSMAVTGFSGTAIPGIDQGLPPGVKPMDETFIDPAGVSLHIFDVSSLGGPATGQLVNTPPPFEVTAGQIGQVFGITYDDGVRNGTPSGVPNLYAAATSLYGIQIVTPDADGDGRPERQRRGTAGARFMDGQFGTENGGGPGTIWNINGITGAVSKFANIDTNSGPGLGDVSFDADHRQFFASDLDNGLIDRIDADGKVIDSFDHGVNGRPQHKLEPVPDDGAIMDIQGAAFDSENPDSWGMTQDERRVWSVAYHAGRLYYSVGEKAEIWSVGIGKDGTFAGDARWELTVKADQDYAVTDIAFDDQGRMYLAQRGPMQNRYDYSQFAQSGKAEVLRYRQENPDDPATESTWVADPEEYAAGFPDGNRQSAGGLDLQYGYDDQGNFDGRCMATLVNTGDRLRDNPALADRLAAGGPAAVHGVQLTPMELVKPQNVPPFGSWFVDYDGFFDDPTYQGHVGDVEVWRPCEPGQSDQALEEALPDNPSDVTIIIDLPVCKQGERPDSHKCRDRDPDLKVEKRAAVKRCTMGGGCDFVITVTNVGDAPYHGKIVLDEVTLPAGSTLDSGPNAPWVCAPLTSPMTCTHPAMTLDPGQSVDLKLGFKPAGNFEGRIFANCARYDYKASAKPVFGRQDNDRACARIPICRRGDRDRECQPHEDKTNLILKKRARTPMCAADGTCTFIIDIINNGGQTYNGPLTVTDTYPTGAPASSTFGPSPPWTCGPNGPGQFRCDNPGIVLVPGASTSIAVKATLPAGYQGNTVQNCAEVKAIAGETDLSNNKACATERVRNPNGGKPVLTIAKTCDTAAASATSSCRITVSNTGTAAPDGPVHVADAATLIGGGSPVTIQSVTPDGPDWSCGSTPSTSLACDIPGDVMAPGTSRHFDVTVSARQEFENCARGSFGPAPGDDQVFPFGKACAKGGNQTDIRVEKTGDAECEAGQPCHFEITITNDSDKPFSGAMRVGDAIGVDGIGRLDGVPVSEISPPFGCPDEPSTLPLSCITTLTLGALESQSHKVTVTIPDSALAGKSGTLNAENCVGVVPPDQPVSGGGGIAAGGNAGGDSGKAYACHPFTIKHEVKNQCSDGFVLNDAGRCVCPQGTSYRNGKCTASQTPPPPEKQCVLLEGQIRTDDGRCVCPKGTDLVNGACAKTTTECTGGQMANADGECECPRGTELRNGKCQPPRAKCTIPGSVPLSDGSGCGCPDGTHLTKKGCVKDKPKPQCTIKGQYLNGSGTCVCPRGQQSDGRKCVVVKKQPPAQEECDIRGQIHNKRGQCVCPKGTVVMDDACVQVEKKQCPPGTVGRYPHCHEVDDDGPKVYINPGDILNLIPHHHRPHRYDDSGGRIMNRPYYND